MVITYKPTTYDEAKEKGVKVKGIINGKEYTGYEYEGYFFHKYDSIGGQKGNCKILSKYCDNVRCM